jgi:hypothetical protein
VDRFEDGVRHENDLHGFPPDRVGRSCLEELALGDGELLLDIVSGKKLWF